MLITATGSVGAITAANRNAVIALVSMSQSVGVTLLSHLSTQ